MGVRFSLLIGLAALLFGCKGKDEPIPSYIRIDSASLNVQSFQGNNVHQIKAVYVYSPTKLLGIFELPAVIPILLDGKTKISLVPAVFLNGSNNQIVAESQFTPLDSTLNLERGKIATFSNPTFKFRPNCKMEWAEDFEDNSSTVIGIYVPKGDTTQISNTAFNLNGRFGSNSKVFSAIIKASDTSKYLDLGSFKTFENLPNDGRDIFLEFSLKSDVPVQLALKRTTLSGSEFVPYLYLYGTNGEWKHFYVNLVYEVGGQATTTKYQILFSSTFGASSSERKVELDNIRLSYNN